MGRLVTAIQPFSKTKVKVFLDEEFAFVLYEGELLRYGIREGGEISDEVYDTILNEVLLKRGKERLGYMLSDSDKTEFQAMTKLLQNGYPKEIAEEVIAFGKQHRMLDDKRYAENFLLSRQGKKSRSFLIREMEKRGLSRSVIDEVMEAYDSDDEIQVICSEIRKKWAGKDSFTYEEKQKLIAFFARKGYSVSNVRRALQSLDME